MRSSNASKSRRACLWSLLKVHCLLLVPPPYRISSKASIRSTEQVLLTRHDEHPVCRGSELRQLCYPVEGQEESHTEVSWERCQSEPVPCGVPEHLSQVSSQAYYTRLHCNQDQAGKIKAIYDKNAHFSRIFIFDLYDESGRGVEHQAEAKALLTELSADEETRANLGSRWGVAYVDSWTTRACINEEGETIEPKKTRTLVQWSVIFITNEL
jgi:hypothetical protein